MDLGIITELSNYLGIKTEAVIELGNRLGNNPDLIKAMITGLATSFGKVAGESTLKQLDSNGGKLLDSAGKLTQQARQLLVPIASEYVKKYTDRHCQLKVLDMKSPVGLDSIYTKVNFDPECIQSYQTIYTRRQDFVKRDSSKKDCRLGMTVANETPYMMVVAGPGMGKSTFLRKVGLEALKQGQGEYKHTCIPVFLELRKCLRDNVNGINLQEMIAEEFQNCGLPEYQRYTEELLKKGELLILFDGLDEVPTEQLGRMTSAIKDFVDRYSKNRFIASCRIAAYRSFQNFSRFTTVEIAKFDESQIQYFIENWFESHERPEWGQECQTRLNSDEATRELAQTPLLLTLICIVFLKQGEFPTNRSTLYDKALSILLAEWNTSKGIIWQQLYEGFDTRRMEIMLAEIAHSNFSSNNQFFQKGEIVQQIEQILKEVLPKGRQTNGKDVLRAVAVQNGLLVERDDDLYSFSHLTIQEFLTAKHIYENRLDINLTVNDHFCDKRWREVFLLFAGLTKADELLLAINKKASNYMANTKLQKLLKWVEKVADPTPGDFQPVGKRAIANASAITIANANTIANSIAIADVNANVNPFIQAAANANAIVIANDFAIVNAIENAIANAYAYSFAIARTNANQAIDNFIKYAELAINSKIYQGLDLTAAISKVEKLRNQIPDDSQSELVRKNFAKRLIKIFLETFHLTEEIVNLSNDEIRAVDNYLYGVRLLIECERAAVRKTPEVWSQIEERLLRPATTTKRWWMVQNFRVWNG
jgi:NACHT domain